MIRLLLIIGLLIGCSSGSDWVYDQSDLPIDHSDSSYVNASIQKASTYQSQQKEDGYGFILPYSGEEFYHTGDALLFNAISASSGCFLGEDISGIWSSIKSLQDESGAFKRHPSNDKGISRDQIIGLLYLGAVSMYKQCSPKNDFATVLVKLTDHLKSQNWKLPNGTYFLNRNPFTSLYHLYDLGVPDLGDLDSISTIKFNAEWADFFFRYHYLCRRENSQFACGIAGNWEPFGFHLQFLSTVIYSIELKVTGSGVLSGNDLKEIWEDTARVGGNLGTYNWLYVSAYRHFQIDEPTYNDVHTFLATGFPDGLPTEVDGVQHWGCTDYIWQRIIEEPCDGANLTYTGIDYRHAFAWTQTGKE